MFRFFRRYQKTFIVVGGVILMFVFTVGDSLTQWVARGQNDSGGRSPGATAVSWDGGQLTEGELDRLVRRRLLVDRFVGTVFQYGMMLASQSNMPNFGPRALPVGRVGQNWTQSMLEENVVNTYLLAEKGHELGIEISDKAVSDYIYDLGMGQLGGDELRSILSEMSPTGRPPSVEMMYSALKEELLAEAVIRAFGAGFNQQDMFAAELPVNRWEEWKRINDRVVLEAAAIDPRSSMLDVAEPTDDQLREFYEEHKDGSGLPVLLRDGTEMPAPSPGFAIPRKVKLQYLRANYDEFVERYKQQVTDEQVREYYEEKKNPMFIEASFDDLEFEDESAAESEQADESMSDEDSGDENAAEDDAASSEENENESEGDAEDTEADAAEPAGDGEEASSGEGGEAASTEGEAEEAASEEPAAGDAAEPSDEADADDEEAQQGALERVKSPFRMVAYQQPADGESEDEGATEAAESDEGDSGEDTTSGEDSAGGDTDAEMAEDAEEIEYQPLEEVEEQIRRTLAENRFFDEIDQEMQSVVSRLNPAYSQYVSKKLDAEGTGGELPDPPEELRNLAPIANELNLEFEETGELNGFQLRDSTVGKSTGVSKYQDNSVTELVFSNRIDLYEPVVTADVGRFGDRYLVMKIEDAEGRVPSFDEVKDQVRQAWKQREAAKLALEQAKKTAEEAEASDLSLKEFMVDRNVVEVTTTPPFTQYTVGDIAPSSGQPTYRLAQPQGLKSVGPEFLDAVFKLKQGEVTALANFDQSIVYLVRMADEYESQEQLRSDFLEQANFWPGRIAFRDLNLQAARRSTAAAILSDLDVDWKRDASADAPEDEAETDTDEE